MPGTGCDIAWRPRRARRRGHQLAFVFAAAVLVSACTSSGTDQGVAPASSTTPTAAAADLMNRAVGGTQSVQDFAVHIDMAKQTANGPVSFYQEVIDRAATGQGDPADLAGGFTFAPTTSIEGWEVDSEGDQLPSLSVDFALLAATPELLGTTQAELIDTLRSSGSAEVADSLMGADPTGTQMLVEIVTANFAQRRTHVGPGDRSLVDITFTSVQPGDKLTSVYLFGQTLPGDPAAEEGMSTYELFTYRWNLGLVSFLAGDGGISTVIDESVDALKGSTIMSRETKKAILAAARYRAALNGVTIADDLAANAREQSEGTYSDEDTVVLPIQDRLVYMPKDRFILYVANTAAVAACEALAAGMNKRNAEAGSAVTDTPSPEAGVDGATTTTQKPGPGPMSCEPNPPRYQDTKLFLGAPAPAAIYGDVHVLTFDGKTYANQAAGEFALFDNGVATMQLRTEPFENSETVSVATALAVRVDGHRVSIHASGDTYIDDALTHLTRGEPRPIGDGALLWSPTGWVLAWPDGTAATITPHDGYLTILITPSANPSTGMLGNADGDPSNDLVTRTGAILAAAATRFDTFYPEYVDTWRITNDESLFHYEAGEDTTTFTIAGFPAAESNVESLREAAREAARDICRQAGITREDVMADCILDVAVTGKESFAYAAFLAEASTPEPEEPPTDGSAGPTETGPDTLTVGDLVLEFGPNPPVQDPAGFQPQWTCSVDNGSFHATSRYGEAPEREIKITIDYLDAAASGTGEERFDVLVELNAQPYAWMVTFVEPPPGSIDEIMLNGTTLSVAGTAYLNDPIDPNLFPFALLPEGSTFQPFRLSVTCDQ